MKIRPIRNHILVAFMQQQNASGNYIETTSWGLEITALDDRQGPGNAQFTQALERGRWALVLAVGNECEEVVNGDYVCLEPNMWTNSFEHDGIKIRKSDESKVMLISKEKPNIFV